MVERLQKLVDDGDAAQVYGASDEEAADTAVKGFPAIAVLFTGARISDRSAVYAGTVAPFFTVGYDVIHYTTSGTPDRDNRVQLYKLCVKSRNRLLGHVIAGQVYNGAPLFAAGETRPERLKILGSAALKMIASYEIDQLVYAQVT